jgi:hypothetical protein
MVDANVVLSEQRPMLAEFLSDVGLSSPDATPDLRALLPEFDQWLAAQVVSEDDKPYLAARLGAYVCLYLADHQAGSVRVVDNRILVSVPNASGVQQEFEPYALAWACASRPPIHFASVLLALVP